MDIARNIWLFSTYLLLVISCFPGVEADDESNFNNLPRPPCQLNGVMDPLWKLIDLMPTSNCLTKLKEEIANQYVNTHIGLTDNQLEKELNLATDCLKQAEGASEKKCKGCEDCTNATNENNDNKCKDCNNMESSTDATNEGNVSAKRKESLAAGSAILFFLLGFVLGLVTLTLVCICCPATHTKTTSLLNAARRSKETKGDKSISRMTLNEAGDEEAIPNSTSVDMTGSQGNRQSNMYNEPDLYNELNSEGEGLPLDTARNQPSLERVDSSGYNHLNSGPVKVSGNPPKHVYSKLSNPDSTVSDPSYGIHQGPTYQPFIPEGNQSENYSALQHDGQRDTAVQSKFDTPSQGTIPAEEPHDYFVLEANNDKAPDTTQGHGIDTQSPETAGHDYFVLEATSDKALDTTPGPGADSNSPETAGHDYFVLEAQTGVK